VKISRKTSQTDAVKPATVLLGYAIDVIGPMAAFFLLNRLGVPPLWSLLLGSAIALGSTTINTVRRGRMDRVGVLVLMEIAISILLLLVWRDPRFLLAKPSLYTTIAGFYLIATSFRGKPLTYDGALQMGTKGDPVRAAAFARCWEKSPQFRNNLRIASLGWGLACLADAVLRVIVVYRFPLERAAWLSNLPHLAAITLLMGFSAMMGRTTHRLVDEELVHMRAGEARAPSRQDAVVQDGVIRST
jgi:hypothetical protein